MKNIQESNFTLVINNLEIYFIVPRKNILNFNISNSKIEGKGLLEPFGWKKNDEQNLKIFGIEFNL